MAGNGSFLGQVVDGLRIMQPSFINLKLGLIVKSIFKSNSGSLLRASLICTSKQLASKRIFHSKSNKTQVLRNMRSPLLKFSGSPLFKAVYLNNDFIFMSFDLRANLLDRQFMFLQFAGNR
ncbi:hypothetical protein EDS67_15920 [candidate division KSB1 bacterium]|nr:MAG: hypothetical protein EDS67_15920 [candidate division KSB1 bacterium]MBC6951827.1 hypothetical protein [candidate division KSB1 bacterium]MCE7942591.1 hypothetical protein [Chlorobi bacterium CHB1]